MLISECCNAALLIVNADEGTAYYECKKCGRPTDGRASLDLSVFDSPGDPDE